MSQPLLVETVTGRTMAELRAARDAVKEADLVELRLDGAAGIDVAAALAGRQRPVIVTCRPRWEGGRFDGTEDERRRILDEALQRGAEYVDLEWRAGFEALIQSTGGGRVVLSTHDFDGVPADLPDRVRAMRGTGAEIIKVAVMARRLCDALPLRAVAAGGGAVVIAMGEAGIATRLLAAHFGSCWTYAGNGVAPGQIPAARLVNEFRFRRVRATSAVYGVVGQAAFLSRSPVMHNAAFATADLDAVYVPLQPQDFDDFLQFSDAIDLSGASVTIPFKLDAFQIAVRRDEAAQRIGAVNTLRRTEEGWDATNTDVAGFLEPLMAGHEGGLTAVRAAVLGAGGAARAVVVALASRGARVTVHARRTEQAHEVASLVSGAAVGAWPPQPDSWDLLVNCTPLGGVTSPDDSPLPGGPFHGRLVYDLIYRPAETRLLREARRSGCATINGLPMLIAQAERQYEWWTGRAPHPGAMRTAIETALEAEQPVTQG
jgi:3-dehydroquinate dehydratase/shikimate dehydrogenase